MSGCRRGKGPLVIGITGGLGVGKTTVAQMLAGLGAEVINADAVGHSLYRPGQPAWREIVEAFGPEVLTPRGEVDRRRLASIVFSDGRALARLNAILHPRMYNYFSERISRLRQRGVPAVVLDAALLFEAGWDALVDEAWMVRAPEDRVVERLRERGISREDLRRRLSFQFPEEEKARRADVIIDNGGTLADLKARVLEVWSQRVAGRKCRL